MSNEEVLQWINDTETMLDTVKKRKHVWLGNVTWIIIARYNWGKSDGEGYMK